MGLPWGAGVLTGRFIVRAGRDIGGVQGDCGSAGALCDGAGGVDDGWEVGGAICGAYGGANLACGARVRRSSWGRLIAIR